MKEIFDAVSIRCSRLTTNSYSTSFSLGIYCLNKDIRDPIYSIYGFVRFADEIVDSFHDYDKAQLLHKFMEDTYQAIAMKISLNPILNSFQQTVNKYEVDLELIDHFLKSMEMDLKKVRYDINSFNTYIYGSAEVVGLMCLKVFCNGDKTTYEHLKPYARKLGSAFQKINFLRDLREDYVHMGRSYFPDVDIRVFDENTKQKIEESIEEDFRIAFEGIRKLPKCARFGVYLSYVYYYALFKKIRKTPSGSVLKKRIRIPNQHKFSILFYTYIKHRFNLI
ncbi:Phytoene synthase [Fulvivirga imtechensis AK7]|uniref:Phytoene synthase n=1 Tax=Fulvivirga imtechensis AK7 TaxID=1237149 RepID=L8JT20_9BACT|nr:phytoene/squalene synthase family protein [Fulvivirga imtechensis]ELR70639.1 Phytoene synthase [Fulvivirga imtechensis AK7]